MNTKMLFVLVLGILAVTGYLVLSRGQVRQSQQTTQIEQMPVKQASNIITIKNFSFMPSMLTVKQGEKVTWKNEDSMAHTIKSATFTSQNLNKGDSFEFTFTEKGTFDYVCGIHPSMTGQIVVE